LSGQALPKPQQKPIQQSHFVLSSFTFKVSPMPANAKSLIEAVVHFVLLVLLVIGLEMAGHYFVFDTVQESEELTEQIVSALQSLDPLELKSTFLLILNPDTPPQKSPYYQRCLEQPTGLDCAGDPTCLAAQMMKLESQCLTEAVALWPSAPLHDNVPEAFWRTIVYERSIFSPAERIILLAQLIAGAGLTRALLSWLGLSREIAWYLKPFVYSLGILFFATMTAYPLAYIAKLTLKPIWGLYTVIFANIIHSFAHRMLGRHAGPT
jgi:hypothetical protein